MTKYRTSDFFTGFCIIVLVALFSYLIFEVAISSKATGVQSYNLTAKFSDAAGLSIGSEVRIAGVVVGKVLSMDVDPDTYGAIVGFQVFSDHKIPADTTAAISTIGVFGGFYLNLAVGIDTEYLKENDAILFTKSAVSIDKIIQRFASGDKK